QTPGFIHLPIASFLEFALHLSNSGIWKKTNFDMFVHDQSDKISRDQFLQWFLIVNPLQVFCEENY
ncbi:hypothetical protein PSY28_23285, partial [Shigella flexneri]|nr:hypothetical protein [Shigella flexneri]